MPDILSPSLRCALANYAAARKADADPSPAIDAFVTATATQAPGSVASAEGPIAAEAQLWPRIVKAGWFSRRVLGHKEDAELLKTLPDAAYLFLFHKNGYLRQAALERVAGPVPTPFLAATLAWRRNDWVRQVRQSAEAAIARCLPMTPAEVLAPFYLETTRVRSTWQRWHDRNVLTLDAHAGRPDVAAQIARELAERLTGPLPSWARKLTRLVAFDGYLEMLAREARVPGVRAVAVEALASNRVAWEEGFETYWISKPDGIRGRRPLIRQRALTVTCDSETVLRLGLADRSAEVRRAALRAIIATRLGDAALSEWVKPLVTDPSPSVRAKAGFILERAVAGS